MTETSRRQAFLLAALLGVLALVLWYQWGTGSTSRSGPSAPPLASTAVSPDTEVPVMDVRLDLLERTAPAYRPPQRDPFRFRPRPVPPTAALPPVLPPQPPTFQPPPPTTARAPERIALRFIGHYVTARGRGVAVLRDEQRNVLVQGSAGDIIEGRYRLLSVTPDAVDVAHADGRGRQRIARSGQ